MAFLSFAFCFDSVLCFDILIFFYFVFSFATPGAQLTPTPNIISICFERDGRREYVESK